MSSHECYGSPWEVRRQCEVDGLLQHDRQELLAVEDRLSLDAEGGPVDDASFVLYSLWVLESMSDQDRSMNASTKEVFALILLETELCHTLCCRTRRQKLPRSVHTLVLQTLVTQPTSTCRPDSHH